MRRVFLGPDYFIITGLSIKHVIATKRAVSWARGPAQAHQLHNCLSARQTDMMRSIESKGDVPSKVFFTCFIRSIDIPISPSHHLPRENCLEQVARKLRRRYALMDGAATHLQVPPFISISSRKAKATGKLRASRDGPTYHLRPIIVPQRQKQVPEEKPTSSR